MGARWRGEGTQPLVAKGEAANPRSTEPIAAHRPEPIVVGGGPIA
jgi:hypothetical protein